MSHSSSSSMRVDESLVFDTLERERCKILDILSEGSFGSVYKVCREVRRCKKTLVLKVRVSQKCFTQEAFRWSNLSHRHLVPLVDVMDRGNLLYFLMPLFDCSLKDHVNNLPSNFYVPHAKLCQWSLQLLEAVDFLHTRLHLVHNNITTSHIYVNRGSLLLGNFHHCTHLPEINEGPGNRPLLERRQLAVRQMCKARYFKSVDVWALGKCLYFMAAKQHIVYELPPVSLSDLDKSFLTSLSDLQAISEATETYLQNLESNGNVRQSFVNFLSFLLHPDYRCRVPASVAASHPFFDQPRRVAGVEALLKDGVHSVTAAVNKMLCRVSYSL